MSELFENKNVVIYEAGSGTLLGRLPRLAEVLDVATIMASDRARAMTGVVANSPAVPSPSG